MTDSSVELDPRFMTYNKDDVERILGSVDHIDDAPATDSGNVVKSGGVAAAISEAVRDVKEDVESQKATHADVDEIFAGSGASEGGA